MQLNKWEQHVTQSKPKVLDFFLRFIVVGSILSLPLRHSVLAQMSVLLYGLVVLIVGAASVELYMDKRLIYNLAKRIAELEGKAV